MKKNRLLKRVYASLMTLLGFTACGLDPDFPFGGGAVEYGQPHAEYKLIGTVKDREGQPIEGIRVVFSPRPEEEIYSSYFNDTVYTDAQGRFAKEHLKYDWPDKIPDAQLRFEDVDGPGNGGSFVPRTLSREEMKIEQTKKGMSWFQGAFTLSADTKLEKSE